jgi:hypothetical protein
VIPMRRPGREGFVGRLQRDDTKSDFRDIPAWEIPHLVLSVTKMPGTSHRLEPSVAFRARIEGPKTRCVD